MDLDKLVNEALTSEDCSICSSKCCVYLFVSGDDGPKLQPYEVSGVLSAVLNAKEKIVKEKTGEPYKKLTSNITDGTIIPLPVVIDGLPENVCGAYSLNEEKCFIYHNRPHSCRIYPAYQDENRVVCVDTGCSAHQKVANYLRNHGVCVELFNFSKGNIEIKVKDR
jgi:Fe-S-cluster containining protein